MNSFNNSSNRISVLIFRYNGAIDLAGKKVQVDTDLKMSNSKGFGSVKLLLPDTNPIASEISFSCNHQNKADGSFAVIYGDNKKFQTTLNVLFEETDDLNLDLTVRGDSEMFKEISLQVKAKQETEHDLIAKVNLKADNQHYGLDYEHRASVKEPKFLVVITRPQGTSKILVEAQIESQLKGKGSIALENIEDFNLHANVDGDLSSLEKFHLNGEVDSPKLALNHIAFDFKSKEGGAGRTGFDYKITQDKQAILSGSTDFTTKIDKGRTIIEGKSTIKVADGKSDDVSFKLIRNIFEVSRDGETGFGGIVNIVVGQRNFVGEFKLTEKEFHAKYTGCETKNRCTNIETKSVLERSTIEGFKHNLIVTIDLREVGFSHEFGFKADTSRNGWKFQHSVDAYLQSQDKPEYQYSVFINTAEAGVLLSLPTRHVALDATYKYPEPSPFGVYDGTVSFFMDKKNNPRQKTEIGFRGELKQDNLNQITGKGDIHFEHPRVKKLRVGGEFSANADAMDVKSKLEIDVFRNPMDMIIVLVNFGNTDASGRGFNITSDVEVSSKGLGLNMKYHEHAGFSFDQRLINIGAEITLPLDDFNFGLNVFVNDKNTEVLFIAFGKTLLKSSASYDLSKQDISVETMLQYLGSSDPIVQKSSIIGLTQGTFTMSKGRLFNIDSGYQIGKDLHLLVQGTGKNIFNGKIALDQGHFLSSTYHIDDAQLKAFTVQLQEEVKKDLADANADLQDKVRKLQTFWSFKVDKIMQASPEFSQLYNEYQQEVAKLIDELKQDSAIKKLIDQITSIISEFAKTFNTLATAFSVQLATIETTVKQYYEQLSKAFNEKILPEVQKLFESLQHLISELYKQSVKLLTAFFERIAKALKAFEADFNTISKALRDATSSTYEAIGQYIRDISQEIKELCAMLKHQIQTLPGVEFIKSKYREILGDFNPIDTLNVVLAELLSSIAQVVPEQARPLFDKFSNYITKVKLFHSISYKNNNLRFFDHRNSVAKQLMTLQCSRNCTKR